MDAQNWTVHQDPAGFAVEVPVGWGVTAEGGRVTVAGPARERVTILPVKVEGGLDIGRAQGVLVNLSKRFWPRQRWDEPPRGWQFGANGVRAVGADTRELREMTALWWANTPEGATGFFYGVAAEPARFDSLESTFARILGSFRVTHVSDGGQQGRDSDPLAGLQFQRWVDPAETAYSCEVPAGWHVIGGVRRVGMFSKVSETVAQSPDGRVLVRSGDVSIPHEFMEPNETLMTLGQFEGQWASGGGYFILRHTPATQFAADYVQRNWGQTCGQIRWLSQRERPDYLQNMAAQGMLLQGNHYTAGEVTFTCESGGGTMIGYLFVVTMMTVAPGVANMWNVQRLEGFFAAADRATQADAVLQRMLATTQVNLQWWYAERGATQKLYEEYRRVREHSAELQRQTQAERWASWERISEQRGDVLIGQTRVVDPQTGQAFKVQSGSSYYWIDPVRNVIAGTDQPYAPTWDFTEMIQTYR
ncbi:MAG TPA: hypothetical protein VEQ42_01565 [Pyrinomonadaceae bacterium]|nr:hypothetical protein [Pyrinomonadaceae bacterium]